MTTLDLITAILSFLFTLLIFSYLIGDNPLFRIAVYIFVGVSSGYIAAIAWWQVIWPRLIQPLISAMLTGSLLEKGLIFVPLLGAVLILMKASPRLAGMSRGVMAFLVGVGAAVTIAGAVMGTLIPQVMGTINSFDLASASARNISLIEVIFNGAFVLAGTIFTLTYFHFGARAKVDGSTRRNGLIEISAWAGRIFIGITLGTVFAGVYAAALTALIERIMSLFNFLGNFL
ncbi:MAG: hypothetical protein HOP27_16440 [Anaerolineales bacterium]|nr:hypothetical protein [Anaerolineales bacterium]